MNTDKITNILALFNNRRVCILNEDALVTKVTTSKVVGHSDNEVLYLGWNDDDHNDYCVKFSEGGLNDAFIKDGTLVMEDVEGDSIEIEFQVIKKHYLVIEEID